MHRPYILSAHCSRLKQLFLYCIITGIFLQPSAAHAVAIQIHCTDQDNECVMTPESIPILDTHDIYPGYVQDPATEISIVNDRSDSCNLHIGVTYISGNRSLTEVLGIKMYSEDETIVNSTLDQLIEFSHQVPTLLPLSTRQYVLRSWMDPDAGNEFQGLTSTTSQHFSFVCTPP